MKHCKRILSFTILLFLVGGEAFSQTSCSNLLNNNRNTSSENHIFGGHTFGQSVVVDPDCFKGNEFTDFSFWSQGNTSTRLDLAIYRGSKVSGTPKYIQKEISLPPANLGGKLQVKLKGGVGSLKFKPGGTYTFVFTLKSGNLIAHTSSNAVNGKALFKNKFDGKKDLLFEVGTKSATHTACSNLYNNNRNTSSENHIFVGSSFGQSIVVDPDCLSGNEFTSFSFWSQGNAGTRLDLVIYQGATVKGTPKYTQKGITLPPANLGGKLEVKLQNGSGNLSFEEGGTYTFVFTLKSGNLIAHTSSNAVIGKALFKNKFDAKKDLLFEVGTKRNSLYP